MTVDAALASFAASLAAGITVGLFFVAVTLFYGRR
jgi:hypothetical protein